jgi:hypothetical protein
VTLEGVASGLDEVIGRAAHDGMLRRRCCPRERRNGIPT